MRRPGNYFIVLLLAVFVLCGAGCQKKYCEPGATQPCTGTDGIEREQVCKDDGSGWEPCDPIQYSYWNDPATNITWQNPQKDAYTEGDGGLTQPDALRYCEELVLGGYDDWRLPNIDEMRTVMRGNPDTETGGNCPMTEGSAMADMGDEACAPIKEFGGPGAGGCYWAPELSGTCDKPDPAAAGHPLEFVSATVSKDNEDWVGCVLFDNGAVSFNHIHSLADVRCVRTGPTTAVKCADGAAEACAPGETRQCTATNGKAGARTCADDGKCWGPCESTGFTPEPPPTDICLECDQINLTIKVPEKLAVTPKQIMAFLYAPEADGKWIFPPMRPPDGGTQENQVIDPVIDVDKPHTMIVMGCSYYREKCLSGDYYLIVFLLNSEKMPPFPADGEYAWGMTQEPMALGSGQQKVIEKEVTLVPCGKDTDGNGIGDACESK